ncbi:hypothetical protein [Amycolatopsis sp. H20-H5]|uniref:hypothetical protein n=1 Tax=Amycolatopsis sp. H20-H5 TaxID=3046309 RepID=UPI002DBA3DD0|nr:hypothetical protein [Amycolatopsis sp. H20-H5]MEC3977314.1 hypothetical protein [Amycolatopsis sp. H20-H5]
MLKKTGFVVAAAAAGMLMMGGLASAGTVHHGHDWDGDFGDYANYGQVGLVNLNNTDIAHNVNGTLGLCGNDVNVLGVQVPIRDSLNGVGVPILSPGKHEAGSSQLSNCASGGVIDGGSSQHN